MQIYKATSLLKFSKIFQGLLYKILALPSYALIMNMPLLICLILAVSSFLFNSSNIQSVASP